MKKLLVANRGEVACRIFRTAREMGIETVAVYSEADAAMPHVLLADEAICIGPGESAKSYLVADKILDAARQTGADAIHPGYGFLSERDTFCDAVTDAGLIFVGPPSVAMRALGGKIESKQLAVRCGVPVTPGYFETGATYDDLAAAAEKIGYPVMLKASAGGGGRGMRAVYQPQDLESNFHLATTEAVNAFGDGAMMIEKLILQPRHLEVQVIADQHGNVACLFERECSLQRRNQKLIEEAGSPIMTAELWDRMQTSIKKLFREAGYYGAGTVEFIFDEPTGEFYFMEVNARLQVEHPVTESVTGLDLVRHQIEVARGHKLSIDQRLIDGDRSALRGHSIEARIVAEDPAAGFMPSIGKILGWAEPKAPGVRVDTGYAAGLEVSRFYDSLLAKVIVHAEDRAGAIAKLKHALLDFHILGVKTNIPYLIDVLDHPDYQAGKMDTGFLERNFGDWAPNEDLPDCLGALVGAAGTAPVSAGVDGGIERVATAWETIGNFKSSGN